MDSFSWRRLVGAANESQVVVGQVDAISLVDCGSMVTTISKSFYENHLKTRYILHELTELSIEVGGGYQLDYLGFVDVDLDFPENVCGHEAHLPVLALIVPDTPYNAKVPVCIGTNVIGLCRDHCKKDFGPQFLQRVMMPTAWEVAYRSLSYSAAVSIKAPVKVTKPIMIGPEQQVVIHGYCRVGSSARGNLLVDSSVDCNLPGGLVL